LASRMQPRFYEPGGATDADAATGRAASVATGA